MGLLPREPIAPIGHLVELAETLHRFVGPLLPGGQRCEAFFPR
jgi:hypothetical protein